MHFTKAFEAMALLLLREMPVATVAQFLDETDTRLWRMVFAHVDAAYPKKDMSDVTSVGVDEMSIRKGHEYLTVFADLDKKSVLFATEGKDKQTWKAFIEETRDEAIPTSSWFLAVFGGIVCRIGGDDARKHVPSDVGVRHRVASKLLRF